MAGCKSAPNRCGKRAGLGALFPKVPFVTREFVRWSDCGRFPSFRVRLRAGGEGRCFYFDDVRYWSSRRIGVESC